MVTRKNNNHHDRNINQNVNENDTTTISDDSLVAAEDPASLLLLRSDRKRSQRNHQFCINRLLPAWEKSIKETLSEDRTRMEQRKFSKFQLVIVILAFRICYLMAMMISCHFIPEHNPGDDVLKFDLRLTFNTNNDNDNENNNNYPLASCFCLVGQSCDWRTLSRLHSTTTTMPSVECAILSSSENSTNAVWGFLLEPFTKWDAARFLHLALNPRLRDPQYKYNNKDGKFDEASEQAHAFLPMFPWIIRYTALILHQLLPTVLLPPTYEALLVLSGVLFNNLICLTISTLTLYDITLHILLGGNDDVISNSVKQHDVAASVCLVFAIFNPAIVFFATNYSESFFAMMTFLGHRSMQHRKTSTNYIRSSLWWGMGILCWMIGSYTRSNGTIHSLALLQDGLAVTCHQYMELRRFNRIGIPSVSSIVSSVLPAILTSLIGAMLIAFPLQYHDWQGYQRHCMDTGLHRPEWCLEDNTTVLGSSSFSLYRYVQTKHWNVGLFRYYQWKQIPNFVLAAPILVLSLGGAVAWIHWSLVTDFGKGKVPTNLRMICWEWPIQALSDSLGPTKSIRTGRSTRLTEYFLLKNPGLLGQYAVLAILALVGLLIAHVQISTRLICSSSPAAIWFLTYCMVNPNFRIRQVVGHYVLLYMILGMILHVNFLPWT
jgi:GPI mannosyltransferase 2